jgi:hypothetical protein
VTGGGDGARVVLTCDPWKNVKGTRTFSQWFNTACFEPPIAGVTGQVATTANPNGVAPSFYSTGNGAFSGKVNYFLPGYTNFETALVKDIPIKEGKAALQLRVETYNTFNHTEFNAVNNTATFASAPTAATIAAGTLTQTSAVQTNSTFGQLSGTANPRYMQIALRLDF